VRKKRGLLEGWAHRPRTARATTLRAREILGWAAGETNAAVARDLRVRKQTVGGWRSRILAKRHGTTPLFAALDAKSVEFRRLLAPSRPPSGRTSISIASWTTTSALHSEGASWINPVECWFALLTDKQLRRGAVEARGTSRRPSIAPCRSTTTSFGPSD
jgi:hypothetical protein